MVALQISSSGVEINCIPKTDVLFGTFLVLLAVLSAVFRSFLPLQLLAGWFLIYIIADYFYDCREGFKNPFYYLAGKFIHKRYHWYYIKESFHHKDFSCLYKEMSFSVYQSLFMYIGETAKLWMFMITCAASLILTAAMMRI